jgi:hypothetical protein
LPPSQPWALRGNPFRILGLRRFMVPIHAQKRNNPFHEPCVAARGGQCRERWASGRSLPLTATPSLREREHRRPIRIGGTVWCVRPRAGRRSKAGSPLRSAPALHRVELNRSGPEEERERTTKFIEL